MSRWLQEQTTQLLGARTSRRGFLARTAVVGSALATNPLDYVLKPTSAYAATCQCRNQPCVCGTACCDGYTDFCCTLNGLNTCPSGTIPGGWWQADGSGFCGGPRYYIDCNVAPGFNPCSCKCALDDCNHRVTCCTQFRYGQCHQEIPQVGAIMCRVVTCTPPWLFDPTCTTDVLVDNNTLFHDAACLHQSPPPPPPPPPPPTPRRTGTLLAGGWFLRKTVTSGVADIQLGYGNPGDVPVVGDWNGDGVDGIGVFRNGVWYLRNTLTSGAADLVVGYGNPGDVPVVGDWNGDGVDGIGVFRNGVWFLRNTLTTGTAEIHLSFGDPGDHPIAGRWSASATIDTPGVVRNGVWYLRNSLTSGVADLVVSYGNPGDVPVVGDWNGDGIDTPGVVRGTTWYLRNANSSGVADVTLTYGEPDDLPFAGRWVVGHSAPGVGR